MRLGRAARGRPPSWHEEWDPGRASRCPPNNEAAARATVRPCVDCPRSRAAHDSTAPTPPAEPQERTRAAKQIHQAKSVLLHTRPAYALRDARPRRPGGQVFPFPCFLSGPPTWFARSSASQSTSFARARQIGRRQGGRVPTAVHTAQASSWCEEGRGCRPSSRSGQPTRARL